MLRSPQKDIWSSAAKQWCSILLNNWSRWGLVLKGKQEKLKKLIQLIRCNPSLRKPRDPKLIWEAAINLHRCCQAKSVSTQRCWYGGSMVHQGCSNVNTFGVKGVSRDLEYSTEPFYVFFSPHLLQWLMRMLGSCSTVKLRKCFAYDVTSPEFPSAFRWWDHDRIFWWPLPLTDHSLFFCLFVCLHKHKQTLSTLTTLYFYLLSFCWFKDSKNIISVKNTAIHGWTEVG